MTTAIKASGQLIYEDSTALGEAVNSNSNSLDEIEGADELAKILKFGMKQDATGTRLKLKVDASLTTDAKRWFLEMIDGAVGAARDGWIDTWDESGSHDYFTRLHAGGRSEQVEGSYPG